MHLRSILLTGIDIICLAHALDCIKRGFVLTEPYSQTRSKTVLVQMALYIWLTFCNPQTALMSSRIHFVPAQICFPPLIPGETSVLQPQVLLDTLSAHCTSPGTAWGQPLPDLSLVSVLTQTKKERKRDYWKVAIKSL